MLRPFGPCGHVQMRLSTRLYVRIRDTQIVRLVEQLRAALAVPPLFCSLPSIVGTALSLAAGGVRVSADRAYLRVPNAVTEADPVLAGSAARSIAIADADLPRRCRPSLQIDRGATHRTLLPLHAGSLPPANEAEVRDYTIHQRWHATHLRLPCPDSQANQQYQWAHSLVRLAASRLLTVAVSRLPAQIRTAWVCGSAGSSTGPSDRQMCQ